MVPKATSPPTIALVPSPGGIAYFRKLCHENYVTNSQYLYSSCLAQLSPLSSFFPVHFLIVCKNTGN